MMLRTGLATLVAFAAAPAALADTLKVPGDYATIQAAVDAAGPGDVVMVAAGGYGGGVHLAGKSDLEIRGKGWPILHGPVGLVIDEGCNGILVRGFDIDAAQITINDSQHVTLSRLRIHDATVGVDTWNMNGLVISKCGFQDISDDAIYGIDILGLVIEKCLFEWIGDSVATLQANIGSGAPGAVFSKNRVIVALKGFVIGGTNNLVEKNRMEGVAGEGIAADGVTDSTGMTALKNRIQTTGAYAIRCGWPNALVAKNTVGGGGIRCEGTGQTITGNKVNDVITHGIYLIGTGTVERNKVRGTSEVGIFVVGDNATLSGNLVVDAGLAGIFLNGADCEFVKNRVSNTTVNGIYVYGTGNEFTSNRASGSGEFDLADAMAEGANTYVKNHFGTMQFNYVP